MDQDAIRYGGTPRPKRDCVRWGLCSFKKVHSLPILGHVRCSQMAGWFRMPLGMQVGLGSVDIVLQWTKLPQKEHSPPQFSAHFNYGQTAGRIKMPHGTDVGLGQKTLCHMAAQLPQKKRHGPQFTVHVYCGQRSPITGTAELVFPEHVGFCF